MVKGTAMGTAQALRLKLPPALRASTVYVPDRAAIDPTIEKFSLAQGAAAYALGCRTRENRVRQMKLASAIKPSEPSAAVEGSGMASK